MFFVFRDQDDLTCEIIRNSTSDANAFQQKTGAMVATYVIIVLAGFKLLMEVGQVYSTIVICFRDGTEVE